MREPYGPAHGLKKIADRARIRADPLGPPALAIAAHRHAAVAKGSAYRDRIAGDGGAGTMPAVPGERSFADPAALRPCGLWLKAAGLIGYSVRAAMAQFVPLLW